jgi:hypothetical protein
MNPERLVQALDSNKGHHGDMFNEAMSKIREAASRGNHKLGFAVAWFAFIWTCAAREGGLEFAASF